MKKNIIVILIALAVIALYASFINGKLKAGSDSIEYYRLAESICQGRGYTIEGAFISKWPPVTPLLLALGLGVFHAGVAGQKVILGTLALAGLVLSYLLLQRRSPKPLSGLVVVLAAVSFPFIYWVLDFSSEGPYFFFTMAALLLGQLAFDEQKPHWAILAGACIGLAILTRTAGFTMLAGFGLYSVIRLVRDRRTVLQPIILMALPALILVGGWFYYAKAQSGETSVGAYSKYGFRSNMYDPNSQSGVGTVVSRAKENLIGYAFIFSVPDASLRMKRMSHLNPKGLFSLAIMGLALAGFLWHLARQPQLTECYLLAYGGILLVFNWYDIRYMVPILPLLFYYFACSVEKIATWAAERAKQPAWPTPITAAVIILLILANVGVCVATQPAKRLRSPRYDGSVGEIHDAAMWIKDKDPQAVVMCRTANMAWFWTHMQFEGIPLLPPDEMWHYMQDHKITMVIDDIDEFSGVTGQYLDPALAAHKNNLKEVMVFGKTRVLQIIP